MARSFFDSDFQSFRRLKLDRFRAFFLSEDVVARALEWQPKIVPVSGVQLSPSTVRRVLRLVLPFSKRCLGLAGKLQDLSLSWKHVFERMGFQFDLAIVWSRGNRPLKQTVCLPVALDLHVLKQVRAIYGR
jgi:hypothetical protein